MSFNWKEVFLMRSNTLVPVTILTGYLGAGKTTVLNYILNNQEGYKVAVIVNDIGEVNIDAELIERGTSVSTLDDSLVPLSNGCICCTLKTDLIEQVAKLVLTKKYDYVLIEASGICEPLPIAQSITMLDGSVPEANLPSICRLDTVATVVDAYRMATEFFSGAPLLNADNLDEDDIVNLLVQQIEFCNLIILNKVDMVTAEQLNQLKAVIKELQPEAEIIETNFGQVVPADILNTRLFDLEAASMSAGWIKALNADIDDDDDEEDDDHHHVHEHEEHDEHHEHEHEHKHHHHHGEGEAEEYGISSFVYYRRLPFDYKKFADFIEDCWPESVIRCKGVLWLSDQDDMMLMFEEAGISIDIQPVGRWLATGTEREIKKELLKDPKLREEWDPKYGDRMNKLVFIGLKMDKENIISQLDACLAK
jgi:G3E family GTPase